VTVPAGSLASITTEAAALRTLGYNRTDRKYLMWTDATVLCGIATNYQDDRPAQDNYNNGYAASFSRVDTPCWGRDDHSTEAHELTHSLGAVQAGAPHGTLYGHCTDESDIMCYADGLPLVTTCAPAQEYLLDCNGDDYFSTFPKAGSWLASHWNVASSKWLIGGGDGASFSGTPGTLRADVTAAVAIPGLRTPVSVVVTAPAGHAHTVVWSSAQPTCEILPVAGQPDAGQLLCDAGSQSWHTQVTATVTDTADGRVTTAGAPAHFTSASRTATIALTVDGHPAPTALDVCAETPDTLSVLVRDVVTAAPVKGVYVRLSTGAYLQTDNAGTATLGATLPAGPLTASVVAGTPLAPGFTPVTSPAATLVLSCGPATLTATLSPAAAAPGDAISVTGTVTGRTGPLAGQPVVVTYPAGPGTSTLTVSTDYVGSYTAVFTAAASGAVTADVTPTLASTYKPATQRASTLTVTQRASTLTLVVPAAGSVGTDLTLTGTLQDSGNGAPVVGATVTGSLEIDGSLPVDWSATTAADGTYSAVVTPGEAGTATVSAATTGTTRFAASAASPVVVLVAPLPVASVTTLSLAPTTYGGTLVVSGTLRSAGLPVPAALVTLTRTTAAGAVQATATTTTAGTFTATFAASTAPGTVTATFAGSSTLTSSTVSASFILAVAPAAVTLTATPAPVLPGGVVTLAGKVSYLTGSSAGVGVPSSPIRLTYTMPGRAAVILGTATSAAGTFTVSVAAPATGTVVAVASATSTSAAATSAAVAVTVAPYTTKLSVASNVATRTGAGAVVFTGKVTRTLGAATSYYPYARVTLTQRYTGGVRTLGTVYANVYGAYTYAPSLSYTGTVTATVAAATVYTAGTSNVLTVRVGFLTTLARSASLVRAGSYVRLTARINPARAGVLVTLQRYNGKAWASVVASRTTTGGATWLIRQSARGTVSYRVLVTGDSLNLAGAAGTTVRYY